MLDIGNVRTFVVNDRWALIRFIKTF